MKSAVCASDTVSDIAFFMRVLVPVMITALLTSGAIVSAATLEPMLLSIVEVAVWIFYVVLLCLRL